MNTPEYEQPQEPEYYPPVMRPMIDSIIRENRAETPYRKNDRPEEYYVLYYQVIKGRIQEF